MHCIWTMECVLLAAVLGGLKSVHSWPGSCACMSSCRLVSNDRQNR